MSDNPFDSIKNNYKLAADTTKPGAGEGARNRENDRVDARAKVSGKAKFSADFVFPNLAYGILVGSTIAKGSIAGFDLKAAEKAPGVLSVITHLNAPEVPGYVTDAVKGKAVWSNRGGLKIFNDEKIYYYGQPVVMVIADSLERAWHAAQLVKVRYNKQVHQTNLELMRAEAPPAQNANMADYRRGDGDVYRNAPVYIESEYKVPIEVHNPMEPHATLAIWDGNDKVTLYDKTQGIKSTQQAIMEAFQLKEENVKVISEYVGGAFGSASRPWPHVIAAVMGAKVTGRPLKLVLHREQMFNNVGFRPWSFQKIGIGATREGKLFGITHEAVSHTSSYEEFTERIVTVSRFLYACPNVHTLYRLSKLDISTPTWMRGPGPATGSFALESALDELAYALSMDPVELRLRNDTTTDPEKNLPFSSRFLQECYTTGAEKIGWWRRNPKPRSMQENGWLVGYGMATGYYGASKDESSALARINASGKLILQSAVSDMGAGTATAMTLIASQQMGIPVQNIEFQMGDSSFPPGPMQVGSRTTSALGSAIFDACTELKSRLADLAIDKGHFHNVRKQEILFRDGYITTAANPSQRISYAELLNAAGMDSLTVLQDSKAKSQADKYSMYSFSAPFVKLKVHPTTGEVRIIQVVVVVDAGKIISPKTASSQMIGGAVGGIGMALTEEAVIDHRFGCIINNNLADYHVPVNADVPDIEVHFVDKPDPVINPLGSKGLGEVAIVGFAPAITNAIYHATGKRVRELPVTPDKLI